MPSYYLLNCTSPGKLDSEKDPKLREEYDACLEKLATDPTGLPVRIVFIFYNLDLSRKKK